jgi:hypothetical protein
MPEETALFCKKYLWRITWVWLWSGRGWGRDVKKSRTSRWRRTIPETSWIHTITSKKNTKQKRKS